MTYCVVKQNDKMTKVFSRNGFKTKTINPTCTWMNLNDHSSYHRVLKQFNRHKIHVLHGNNALICKIHHTVRHCLNVFMRILTLKYSASFEITSFRIILKQGTRASPSLFKHKQVSDAIFSISIMDLGKMCEIQSWPATLKKKSNFIHIIVTFTTQSEQYKYI